ncbi:hypothetical protein [Streptomyces sp. NPDC057284]|uniref:hypothetical protein n=1 Tax=Streptomyces sp. NPDC057284 TaxID=3346083 RepID=UPI00363ECB53
MDRHATSGTRTAPNTGADHPTVGVPTASPRQRGAWPSTEAHLTLNRHPLDYPPKAAVALVRYAAGTLGVARIARQLPDRTNN